MRKLNKHGQNIEIHAATYEVRGVQKGSAAFTARLENRGDNFHPQRLFFLLLGSDLQSFFFQRYESIINSVSSFLCYAAKGGFSGRGNSTRESIVYKRARQGARKGHK